MKKHLLFASSILLSTLFLSKLNAQDFPAYSPVLSEIGTLESARDPKCHATASRLEDFLYGTPLSFGARKERINFQQSLVQNIWMAYTNAKEENPDSEELNLFKAVVAQRLAFREDDKGVELLLPSGQKMQITARDYRQYSSIAYAYRAILAVQQSCVMADQKLASLEGSTLEYFKKIIDISVLGLLQQADQIARRNNSHQIEDAHLLEAAAKWSFPVVEISPMLGGSSIKPSAFIYPLVEQKLAAYQAYNQISQAVFLRNVQVYFSKMPWPVTTEESNELKNYFTEMLVAFSGEVLLHSQTLAQTAGRSNIRYEDVYRAVQDYLPHSVNPFEDVDYFPRLAPTNNTVIQAYDLDAFRDSGLHWQYLKFALDDQGEALKLLPDPFALEMLVEGIAQFAVLIFRVAGEDAKAQNQERLAIANLNEAFLKFKANLQQYEALPPPSKEAPQMASAQNRAPINTDQLFVEVGHQMGVNFEHRNSDWLSRLIRGYVVKEDENLARLSIPPAFGGGGVAAEDIDGDGWDDLLLLGGQGCTLYRNDEGKSFTPMTETAGINWQRADGTYPEPRQPLIADFNNDGKQDILIIYADDQHRLFQNEGNWQFTDQTAKAQLGGADLIAGPATVIDYDRDGLLDIYIGYFGNYLKGELPTLKRHNTNGSPNKLYRNLGNFRFVDASAGSGVENQGWTQAVGHTDINGDGWQDLIAGNDFGINSYYLNNQDGTFTDISNQIGTDKPSYTMNVGVGDINGDLAPDFYISNIVVMEKDDKYVLPNEDTRAHFDAKSLATMRVVEANDLFVSNKANGATPVFEQATNIGRGYSSTGWSWDADFFDYDNDSDLDLYCLTGMNQYSVYSAENPYYTSPDGAEVDVTFATSSAENNILFENTAGTLQVATIPGELAYSGTSRSAAYFDFDKDGDLDIIVNEYQGRARLFRNQAERNQYHWVSLRLHTTKEGINRDAIGAQVILTLPDGRQLWREVHSTDGYLSVHPKTLHFGLGEATRFELEIVWPDGQKEKRSDLGIDKFYQILQK
ncbi:CRTAC1 family protein [Lewinella cohaerens]|uniref:CRTAC1 family protein n=1 Tax=Lewinella cohaerens TaxID=70995 RepID=UPI0003810DFE|nr:CRTAC1 family protein [Lewinella cohaerens]